LHILTLNDFRNEPIVNNFELPFVNGPNIFPFPRKSPLRVLLATNNLGNFSFVTIT